MDLNSQTLKGAAPAIVTPFLESGEIDYKSLDSLIDYQLKAGVDGIVACGSTGEAATLTDAERVSVISHVVKRASGQAYVIAGIGASSTKVAQDMARQYSELGVDGLLLVAPFYNKPSQEGIYQHFASVAQSTKSPIVAYNVPGRTASNILPSTVARLAKDNLIIGLKDASGSVDQTLDTLALVGNSISLLSGEDSLTYPMMTCGARGTISATGNIVPKLVADLTHFANSGDYKAALDVHWKFLPFARAMFIETNPVPVKAALAIKGIIASPTVRLPLTPAAPQTVEKLKALISGNL
ncbi:MAG: 4-hydroxy-tetrahydrodipicolinate synthase [Bdellovibrionales bacterium]|nr:4-hydroxy-tetrahydrodipicolinate synthase [Bdellovibrionales bacterium]